MLLPTIVRFGRLGLLALAGFMLLAGDAPRAAERNSATVSILDGSATNSSGGTAAPAALAVGATVFENDIVETAASSRMELKLKDGSVIRVGPASKLALKSAYFGEGGEKKFSAKLFFGRVWSKVSGLVGSDSKFEVETDNAVAGVRGTTFRVDAKTDKSVLVRVYAGSVAMAAPGAVRPEHATKKGHHQIAPPYHQVSKGEWEKLVGKMMELRVSADGTPGEPTAFTAEADQGDDWAAWNEALDSK
jgi:ferric-dicitrate binding protein FerR (iron transport regulator)